MTEITRKVSDFILVNPKTIHVSIDPETPKTSKYYEQPKPYWLYVLRLEDDRYYVGFTGKTNPYDRIMQHVEGEGAKWTQIHKPLEVIEIRDAGIITLSQIKSLEQNLTWEYMILYGANRVRGGIFNYIGRILRVGDRVVMGYQFDFYVVCFLFLFLDVYIVLRHYFNWW